MDVAAAAKRSKCYSCGHCGQSVSKTVYYQHKRLYYRDSTNSWIQGNYKSPTDEVEDFVFYDDSNEEGVHEEESSEPQAFRDNMTGKISICLLWGSNYSIRGFNRGFMTCNESFVLPRPSVLSILCSGGHGVMDSDEHDSEHDSDFIMEEVRLSSLYMYV